MQKLLRLNELKASKRARLMARGSDLAARFCGNTKRKQDLSKQPNAIPDRLASPLLPLHHCWFYNSCIGVHLEEQLRSKSSRQGSEDGHREGGVPGKQSSDWDFYTNLCSLYR